MGFVSLLKKEILIFLNNNSCVKKCMHRFYRYIEGRVGNGVYGTKTITYLFSLFKQFPAKQISDESREAVSQLCFSYKKVTEMQLNSTAYTAEQRGFSQSMQFKKKSADFISFPPAFINLLALDNMYFVAYCADNMENDGSTQVGSSEKLCIYNSSKVIQLLNFSQQ